MSHLPIDHSDVPIRLFKSDFLEFFSHISPIAVIVIWVPVAAYFLVSAILNSAVSGFPFYIPFGYLGGLFFWTLAEYLLHRFVFHFPPKTPAMERITFLFHGIHHAQPHIKTRLVMPPAVSLPLALLFFGLFHLIFGAIFHVVHWVAPIFSGFITGYLVYDLTHYATHHIPLRSGAAKYLKRYHMMHHYKTPNQRFGVSSPLWDIVFKTKPEEA